MGLDGRRNQSVGRGKLLAVESNNDVSSQKILRAIATGTASRKTSHGAQRSGVEHNGNPAARLPLPPNATAAYGLSV